MPEIKSTSFYNHTSYGASYYTSYIGLENFISPLVLRGDKSRIFLSSDDYAFRRRFELLTGSKASDEIDLATLDFPFANYSPLNVGWQPLKNNVNTAAMVLRGLDVGNLNIKSYMATLDIPVTFYFDREDDARFAYDSLVFVGFKENYFYSSLGYKGNTVKIPLNIKLSSLSFNPSMAEKDWLTQNRIFTVKATFSIRSVILATPTQTPVGSSYDLDKNNDSPDYVLTEEVILEMMNHKGLLLSNISIKGQLDETGEVVPLEVVDIEKTTAFIKWNTPSKTLSSIIIYPMNQKGQVLDVNSTSYYLEGLNEDSSYTGYIEFHFEDGTYKRSYYGFKTKKSLQAKKRSKNLLEGTSW